MPYDAEPPPEAFKLEHDNLTLTPITEDDAQEVFDLMNHPKLENFDPAERPETVEQLRDEIAKSGDKNTPFKKRYQWVGRRKDTGDAVVIGVAEMTVKDDFVHERDAEGKVTNTTIAEIRTVEPSVYVHPDHQEAKGDRWGKKTGGLLVGFARDGYGCNRRRATIKLTNGKSIRRVEEAGMTLMYKNAPGAPEGFGVWEGDLPPR